MDISHLTGGNIGIMSSLFSNGAATGPPMSWETPMTYPSLLGTTEIRNSVFQDFHNIDCSGKSTQSHALMTHATYGDLIHPITLEKSVLSNVADENKVWFVWVIARKEIISLRKARGLVFFSNTGSTIDGLLDYRQGYQFQII